jgi:hypothetical protein
MGAGNPVLRFVLILAVLGSCLPCFAPEDANRDRRIDLSDAVNQVQHLVAATQSNDATSIDIHKAILAINATAGLETVISPQPPAYSPSGMTVLDRIPYCPTVAVAAADWGDGALCIEPACLFSSLSIAPADPPPRGTSTC